jgi:hypothetical protein
MIPKKAILLSKKCDLEVVDSQRFPLEKLSCLQEKMAFLKQRRHFCSLNRCSFVQIFVAKIIMEKCQGIVLNFSVDRM